MRTLLPLVCLAAAATAQSVVIPSRAATVRPARNPTFSPDVFHAAPAPADSRTQTIIDTQDVMVPAALWRSLAVRRPSGVTLTNSAFTTNITIVLSVSPNAWTAQTGHFASNHGPSPTTVLAGQVSLPARAGDPAWPTAWEVPFAFNQAYLYAGPLGRSLVIDILQTGNSGATSWFVEATSPDLGAGGSNAGLMPYCRFSTGQGTIIHRYQYPTIGGTWFATYVGLVPNTIGFGAIGSRGVGGTWNGIRLPFDLGPLGAPGCSWNVSVEYTVGLASAGIFASWPTLNVPNDPALAGAQFYDQAAFFDAAANPLGFVPTWSSRWTIGSGIGAPGASVAAVGNSARNPTGTLSPGFVATMQLNP